MAWALAHPDAEERCGSAVIIVEGPVPKHGAQARAVEMAHVGQHVLHDGAKARRHRPHATSLPCFFPASRSVVEDGEWDLREV